MESNVNLYDLIDLIKRDINDMHKKIKPDDIISVAEVEKFENAKRGKREDKLFIYEKIRRIIENKYKEIVNESTIDNLIKQYHINYYENLYFDDAKDEDKDFDTFDLSIYTSKVDKATLAVFKDCRDKILFKPSQDKDIIEYFNRFKLSEVSSFSEKLDRLTKIIYQSTWGFGVLEDLIDNIHIFNDVACNRFDYVWVQFKGRKRPLRKIKHKDQADYLRVVTNLSKNNNDGDLNDGNAISEGTLKDMQRVTIICPPITRPNCHVVRVRSQALEHISLEQMVVNKSIGSRFYKFIHLAKNGRLNMGIYGAQGHGKSTIMNALIETLPYYLVQATQESTHELYSDVRYPLKNIIGLQSINQYSREKIYETKLRMALDNDHYGEIRIAEDAYWAKQTLTRQCRGSYFTMHYDDPYNCIDGLAELICTHLKFSDFKIIRYSVAKMINLLINPYKDNDTGKFYIKNVYEVVITDRNNLEFDIRKIFEYDLEKEDLIPVRKISDYTKELMKQYSITNKEIMEIDEIMSSK